MEINKKALETLKKMGIQKSVTAKNMYFVDGNDPDSVCFEAFNKLKDSIVDEKISEEIVEYLEEDLRNEVKVTKLLKVRPYA
ncbi:hypothetical protein CMI37_32695 [Candidatus Pacearchaeota archaeon]|nr:hypothetical protein [Candidatus Pacearchaeota archaeon]|tara:strand:+ start:107 stop:352 length:246 start_codon:yes stop_codon:yes gene_type:complete